MWRWLIGSPRLGLDQPGVELGFEHPFPAWAWALAVLAAAGLGWACYRRLEGSRIWRTTLAGVRGLLLIALCVLAAGPRLIKANETEERDWVLVLVDRSASLTVADVPPSGGRGAGKDAQSQTREQELSAVLAGARETFKSLGAERVVVWLGFDGAAYDLALKPDGTPDLSTPAGRRTDINRAIEQALRKAAARPLAGVVLISDGRSVNEPSRQLVRRLESEKVPVFTVALGSEKGLPDVGIKRVEAPRVAFVKDAVPVQVELTRTGPAISAGGSEPVTVELVDVASGEVLDSKEIHFGPEGRPAGASVTESGEPVEQSQRLTLTTKPSVSGAGAWIVRVRPGASGPDMVAENNTAAMAIELVDRPLRIAYFDGYPRWEYRYLKNLLVRESSLASAVMLLAPDKRYVQEGSVTLDTLPRSPEEWAKFDVLVIGDIWPGVFTNDQLEQIKERVAIGGAGLIFIGGEGSTPGDWRSTALGDLLPVSLSDSASGGSGRGAGLEIFDEPLTMSPTPAAERLGVLRLSDTQTDGLYWPPALSDPGTGWSRLFWGQKIDKSLLKPTAEVLATFKPASEGAAPGNSWPAVLSMRFGAGRVLYVATDEIWRWRYGRGELLPERFWIQLVRLLGRESVARSGRAAILEINPEKSDVGTPVRVQITLLDQSLVDAAAQGLKVRIVREPNPGESPPHAPAADSGAIELTLSPEGGAAGSAGGRTRGSRIFSTTWVPTEAGRYRAEAADPLLVSISGSAARSDLTAKVEVWQSDDELRRPQADHALLTRLSEATGGKTLAAADLDQLPRLLPNRRLRLAGEPEIHTLWDTPLALLLVLGLLTLEWAGRRLMRLV